MSKSDELLTLSKRVERFGLDLEHHIRQEQMSGHLSPTDTASLKRISSFLRQELPDTLKEIQSKSK